MTDQQPDPERIATVIQAVTMTLRQIQYWIPVHPAELEEAAARVETADLAGWTCCPLCREIECDYDCPLAMIRPSEEPPRKT